MSGTGTAAGRDYRMDALFQAPGMNLQLRTYHHASPSQGGKSRRDHVLSFSLTGRGRASTGCFVRRQRQTRPFRFGDITFVPGGVPIVGWGPGGVQQTLSCRFDWGQHPLLASFEQRISDERLLACGDVRTPGIAELLRRIARELRVPGFAHETLVDTLAHAAMIDLVRHVEQADADHVPVKGGLSPLQLRRITDEIERSLGASPTLAALADACDVSRGHLTRSFKKSTGETVHAYVERIRLGRARAMLADPVLRIKDIAFRLGFANANGFAVAFRRATGESPTDYRRSCAIIGEG